MKKILRNIAIALIVYFTGSAIVAHYAEPINKFVQETTKRSRQKNIALTGELSFNINKGPTKILGWFKTKNNSFPLGNNDEFFTPDNIANYDKKTVKIAGITDTYGGKCPTLIKIESIEEVK